MRAGFGTVWLLTLALNTGALAQSAESDILPEWLRLERDKAAEQGPVGLRELACLNAIGRNAFLIMREAADAGDDIATLALSSYLRYGVGTKMDIDAADRLVMKLIIKIRASESAQLPTLYEAARIIYSGRCAPMDIVTARSLTLLDENCRAIEGVKPPWCT